MKKAILILFVLMLSISVFSQAKKNDKPRYVKSYLNQKAPELVVEKWLTEKPDTVGKFILFELYGLLCPPCWEAVPKLNDFHKKYKDKLVVIGVTRQLGRLPQEPDADYYKGVDTEGRTYRALELKFVPWALLIDLNGIVRWEGSPNKLTDEIIDKFLKKYRKKKK